MDNIIQFPKKNKLVSDAPTVEDVNNKMLNLKHHHVNETLSNIVPMLFASIDSAGFDLLDEENESFDDLKDGAFLVESLRSYLCKHYGIGHPFQEIAENVFIMQDDGLNTTFKIVDKLDIEFNNKTTEDS